MPKTYATVQEVLQELEKFKNVKNIEGMCRFGINVAKRFGVNAPKIHEIAKAIGANHELALALWESGYGEARLIAAKIAETDKLTKKLLESWVKDFDSWDVCDCACLYCIRKYPKVFDLAFEWAEKKSEFVRRAGFVLMAVQAVHDKKRDDHDFLLYFPLITKYACDERNFVKKAVNWALRQIGKRSEFLRKECIKLGEEIQKQDSRTAKWVAADALRELRARKIKR